MASTTTTCSSTALVVSPSLDAVQEFTLLQNTYDAEHGRSAGAQVNIVLQSGTRDWNGSAYELLSKIERSTRATRCSPMTSRSRR